MLNDAALRLAEAILNDAERLHITMERAAGGTRLIDCGVNARGGLEAGRRLAEICMAGLGDVAFVPAPVELGGGVAVQVRTDSPIAACMAAQYAGWQVAEGKFFAMASGPMRAAAGKEEIFNKIGHNEQPQTAVGVLESRKLPPDEICQKLAAACRVKPEQLVLLVAPTASQAGGVQILARTVETALHKLFELGFDLGKVESGYGIAPLPPVAQDDLAGVGRTNDAILYGGEVTLWVRGDDASLGQIGPQVPSCASGDFGQPFAAIFDRYERDFYKIDPHLFSPAVVTLVNCDTGNSFRYGRLMPEVLRASFGTREE